MRGADYCSFEGYGCKVIVHSGICLDMLLESARTSGGVIVKPHGGRVAGGDDAFGEAHTGAATGGFYPLNHCRLGTEVHKSHLAVSLAALLADSAEVILGAEPFDIVGGAGYADRES